MGSTPQEDLLKDLDDLAFVKGYVAEEIKLAFGIRLLWERESAGLTRQELAEKAGVTKAYITKLEQGEANPRITTIGAILACLGLNLAIRFYPIKENGGKQ